MGFVTRLPEVAVALVFFVCLTSDVFNEYFHESADIVKTFAPGVDQNVNLIEFVRLQMFNVDVFLRNIFRFVEQMPSGNDVFSVGIVAAIVVNVEYDVIVV